MNTTYDVTANCDVTANFNDDNTRNTCRRNNIRFIVRFTLSLHCIAVKYCDELKDTAHIHYICTYVCNECRIDLLELTLLHALLVFVCSFDDHTYIHMYIHIRDRCYALHGVETSRIFVYM
jgi:hypothetical protein